MEVMFTNLCAGCGLEIPSGHACMIDAFAGKCYHFGCEPKNPVDRQTWERRHNELFAEYEASDGLRSYVNFAQFLSYRIVQMESSKDKK